MRSALTFLSRKNRDTPGNPTGNLADSNISELMMLVICRIPTSAAAVRVAT